MHTVVQVHLYRASRDTDSTHWHIHTHNNMANNMANNINMVKSSSSHSHSHSRSPSHSPSHHCPNKLRKLFQDSIVVNIPIDVTADLGIAIKRTREKRIQALYENFPALKKEEAHQEDKEVLDSEDDEENKGKGNDNDNDNKGNKIKETTGDRTTTTTTTTTTNTTTKEKKERTNSRAPQRNQYGNVLDYLEAKYVRGVMLQDEDDVDDDENGNDDDDDDDDEKRSVYDSESSFLDDSLLKRHVAEQVLTQATHTKLELEHDDNAFFVNVGALEVEDHELMDYDPLLEEEEKSTKKTKRKRLTSPDTNATVSSKSTKQQSAKKDAADTIDRDTVMVHTGTKKAGQKTSGEATNKKKVAVEITRVMQEQIDALKKRAVDLKQKSDKTFEDTCAAIRRMTDKELPRKKKSEKVSIVVPEGKNPGDDITFANPHVPGQKLRVKVPKNGTPGSKFVVSVPVPVKENPDVDNNKWTREAQDLLDDFSHIYDDWCHAEAAWREADPTATKKFQLHHERMNKFDRILAVFPKDLVTPIDGTYLRKVVRRARQNKHKRSKTALRFEEDGITPIPQPPVQKRSNPTRNPQSPSLRLDFRGKVNDSH